MKRALYIGFFFFALTGISEVRASILPKISNGLGLVFFAPFEDGSGTKVTDHSGNGNTGTLTNMEAADWIVGKKGKALDFDGTNEYISVGTLSTVRTVSVWFKHDSPWKNFSRPYGDSDSNLHTVYFGSGGDLNFYYNGTLVGTHTGLSTGQWYHLVTLYDGTNAKAYINGTEVLSSAKTVNDGSRTVYVGAHAPDSQAWDGQLDEVRIYSRALSPAEVTALYQQTGFVRANKQPASPGSGLVGYWRLDEGTGAITADSSGNGSGGVLTNGPSWVSGKYGSALFFDNDDPNSIGVAGTRDYVAIPHNSALATTAGFTMSAWARQTSNVKQTAGIVDKNRVNAWGTFFEESSNKITFMWRNTESLKSGYNLNQWYHVVGTWDGTNQRLYIDGVLADTDANSNGYTGTDEIEIGRLHDGFNLYGNVDDVRVYNRALSGDEITQLYEGVATRINASQNSKLTSGLIALHSFNGRDLTSTTSIDRSGSGYHGALTGSPIPDSGKVGQGFVLNGANSVDISGLVGQPAAITLAGWFNLISRDTGGSEFISIGDAVTIRLDDVGGVGTTAYYHFGSGTWRAHQTLTNYAGTGWHHIAYVVNPAASSQKVYVDGIEKASGTSGDAILYTGDVGTNTFIGKHGNGSAALDFTGSVDEVRVYSRALSEAEVKQLYDAGK